MELDLGVVDEAHRSGDLGCGDLDHAFQHCLCRGDVYLVDFRWVDIGNDAEFLLEDLEGRFGAGEVGFGRPELVLVALVERDRPLVDVEADQGATLTVEVAGERVAVPSLVDRHCDLPALSPLTERRDRVLHDCLLRPPRLAGFTGYQLDCQ